jgi:cytochrome P450
MRAGDAFLVVLAAANRDPAAHPDPHRFDPARRDRGQASFGAGAHLCPGQELAAAIAHAGVEQLLAAGVDLEPLARQAAYRASPNVRIPLLRAREIT